MKTQTQIKEAVAIARAVYQTIKEAGGQVPTGPLYAALMGRIDLNEFDSMLGFLERNNLIKRNGYMVEAL